MEDLVGFFFFSGHQLVFLELYVHSFQFGAKSSSMEALGGALAYLPVIFADIAALIEVLWPFEAVVA